MSQQQQRSTVAMPKQSEQGRKKNPSSKRSGEGARMKPTINKRTANGAAEDATTTKLIVPPTRFKLTKLTPAQTLTQIAEVTQGFFDLPLEDVSWIQNDVRSREFSSFGSLLAHEVPEIHEKVVGKNNHFLDLTRHKHQVAYIGYDSVKNVFQFWGEYQSCVKAMNAIRYRIYSVEDRASRGNELDQPSGCGNDEQEMAYLERQIEAVRSKLDRADLSSTPPPNEEYLIPRSVSCARSISIRHMPGADADADRATPQAYE